MSTPIKSGILMPLANAFYTDVVLKGSTGYCSSDPEYAELMNSKIMQRVNCYQTSQILMLAIDVTVQGLECFLRRELGRFYPLVGENRCEIRAVALARIAPSEQIRETVRIMRVIREFLSQQKAQGDELGCPLMHLQKLGNDEKLKSMLKERGLKVNPTFSDEEKFIAYSYLLTRTRSGQDRSKTDALNLKAINPHIPHPGVFTNMVMRSKDELARLSLDYLSKKVIKVALKEGALLKALVKSTQRAGGNMQAPPCYPSLLAILKGVLQEKGILVLQVNREQGPPLRYAFKGNGSHFRRLSSPEEAAEHAPILVEGECKGEKGMRPDYEALLLGESDELHEFPYSRVAAIILANAAAHPQYAGESKGSKIALFEKSNGIVNLREMLAEIANKTKMDEAKIPAVIAAYPSLLILNANKLCAGYSLEELARFYVRFERMHTLALEEGFCEENPSLFSIKHIRNEDVAGAPHA